jgi:hypothetical protein
MQLAQTTGIKRHINPGKLVGDRELGDGYLLGGAAVADLRLGVVEGGAEGGKLGLCERRRRRAERRLRRLEEGTCASTHDVS